jgi:hypothetical protein
MSSAKQTHPRQAWAHKDGKINMLLHGKQQAIRDPMTWLLIHEAFGRFGMAHDEARFDVLESLFTADRASKDATSWSRAGNPCCRSRPISVATA